MRIAVWHNLPSGGGKRALFEHVRGLLSLGHHVEAWCPPTADRGFLPLSDLVTEHVLPIDWPVPLTRADEWQVTLHTERSIRAMDAHCRLCARAIASGGFDVLFANSCQFYRATAIGRLTPLPSVLYQGEPYRWLYEALPRMLWAAPPVRTSGRLSPAALRATFVDWRQIRNARVQAREEIDNAAAFGRILVNSYFSRETILRSYGIDAHVCYLGVDTVRFAPDGSPRGNVVVGVGSVTPEKNVALVIEALATLPPSRPALIWIGNVAMDYRERMVALAAARGVSLDIRIGITDRELTAALNQAMAMVYAPRLEPFGLAPLEANACATPVVAIPEGGLRETVLDQVNGLVAAPTPRAIGAAIARLQADPGLARRLGESARALVCERWSQDAASARLERHLLDVVSGPGGVQPGQPQPCQSASEPARTAPARPQPFKGAGS